jgi:hypothetical protein
MRHRVAAALLSVCFVPYMSAARADEEAELAKKLQNPVAALVSVPFQYNWDTGIGTADAKRETLNIQPVIPIALNQDWNVISRTILPLINAQSPVPGGESHSGTGDILQSFFFSPKAPTASGWIWGAGPALSLKTASNSQLGAEKWGLGPTVVLLKQEQGWTYGALANHIWSVAGNNNQPDVSSTFLQPFLSYTTATHTTFAINTESTYDWKNKQWTVPINLMASQLVKIGDRPVSFSLGYRHYAEAPAGGPDWGWRFVVTLLFPK